MNLVRDSLATVGLGAPQIHRDLALLPLLSQVEQPAGYVLLDEALERRLARVTEVSEGGSVSELAFENASAEKIRRREAEGRDPGLLRGAAALVRKAVLAASEPNWPPR